MTDGASSLLRRATDALEEIFFVFTPEGDIIEWNKRVNEVTGYSDEEIGRMLPADLVPTEDTELIREKIGDVLEEGDVRFEGRLQAKDGRELPYEFSGSLIEQDGQALICGTGRDITERKQAEKKRTQAQKELEASEERYRRLFEDAQEGIAITTPEGDIVDANPAAAEIFGYSREELLSMNSSDLYASPKKRKEAAEELTEKGVLEGKETRLQRADGKEIICEVSSTVRRGPEGEPKALQGFFRDVTERKEAQEALRESEALHRAVLANLTDTVFITDEEGRFTYVCPNVHFIFGSSAEEVSAYGNIQSFLPELDLDPNTAKEAGEISNLECRITDKEGQEHVLLVNARQVEIDQGSVLFSCRDITERKSAEEALKESEEMFRGLAENALVGIGLLQEGTYEYVNPALAEMTGYLKEELLGESPKLFVHPEDWPYVRRQIEARLEGEIQEAHFETRVLAKSGETRHVEISGTRIDYRGEPAAIATIQDVTERREMQREMIQVQEEERRRIGQDLHDSLASQLTGAGLKLGLFSRRVEEDLSEEEAAEEVQEIQGIIEDSADDVRRLSRGLNPAGLPEGDLLSALQGLAQNTEAASFEADSFEADSFEAEDLEAASSLQSDTATHLYRIAQEATRNVQKYAEASKIEIRLRQEDGTLALEVEDDGKGFDPSEASGEGLGLRSMRHRAELLGAEFTVDSEPGEGTLVRCRMPAAVPV